jgi:flagellar biosynthetic protein FliQ
VTGVGEYMLRVAREGLYLTLLVSAPVLVVSMVVGLVTSVLQAATQVQEQTLSFVPKLVAVFVTLALMGPWIGAQLVRFTVTLFETFPAVVR